MTPNAISRQNKKLNPYPLFLLQKQAQKKKLSKRKRRYRGFALCGARQELRALDGASLFKGLTETLMKKEGENFNFGSDKILIERYQR